MRWHPMSIALFNEPPRVTISSPDSVGGSRNALLMGFDDDDDLNGILCLEDGSVTLLSASLFTIDYRYRAETDRWIDVNAEQPDQ
jgi:hypothetical protein